MSSGLDFGAVAIGTQSQSF